MKPRRHNLTDPPKKSGRRKWAWRLAIAAIALGALMLAGYYGPPAYNHWQVQTLLARFRQNPTQADALRVAEMMEDGQLRQEEGNEMLKLLTQPRILTRNPYRMGRSVGIAFAYPFDIALSRTLTADASISGWAGSERVCDGGHSGGGYDSSWHGLSVERAVFEGKEVRPVGESGRYSLSLQFQHELKPHVVTRTSPWPFPLSLFFKSGGTVTHRTMHYAPSVYSCQYDVPVEFTLSPEPDAERVVVESSPEVDAAVKAAVSALPSQMQTPCGATEVIGGLEIAVRKPLPCDLVLKLVFKDEQGRELKDIYGPQTLSFPDGMKGDLCSIGFLMSGFGGLSPGQHTATLELVSDEQAAYRRSWVKRFWGGKLSFPVTFTVKALTKASQPATGETTTK